jgi:HEAT repeat protein
MTEGSFAESLGDFLCRASALYESQGMPEPSLRAGLRSTFGRLIELSAAADRRLDRMGTELRADGEPFDASAGPGALLLQRMALHDVASILVRRGASGQDLMLLARLLTSRQGGASQPPLDLWHVQVSFGGSRPAPPDPPRQDLHGDAAATVVPRVEARPPVHSDLHAMIRTAADAETVLGQLAARVKQWAAKGHSTGIGYALIELYRLERRSTDPGVLRVCALTRQALATPAVLRQFAELLPRVEKREEHLDALRQFGAAGTNALISQLMAAETLRDRRVYFDAIVSIGLGTEALIDALGHVEWYVVRNAAALLGELMAAEADEALCRVLRHNDERVRNAAAAALRRLGTPLANRVLNETPDDPLPALRRAAVEALPLQSSSASAALQHSALDEEWDEAVRVAVLRGLGRLATPAAVQRLTNAVFQRDGRSASVACRVAAVEALARARGVAALPLLRTLAEGEDPALREPARRLVAQLALS